MFITKPTLTPPQKTKKQKNNLTVCKSQCGSRRCDGRWWKQIVSDDVWPVHCRLSRWGRCWFSAECSSVSDREVVRSNPRTAQASHKRVVKGSFLDSVVRHSGNESDLIRDVVIPRSKKNQLTNQLRRAAIFTPLQTGSLWHNTGVKASQKTDCEFHGDV